MILCAASLAFAYPDIQLKPISPNVFIQNCGQWPDSILFQSKVNGASVWFAKAGIYYQFFRKTEDSLRLPGEQLTRLVHEDFAGGNSVAEVIGEDQSPYYCNYFLSNDSSKWVRHTPTYKSIRYKSIYAGVDLRYYFQNGHLEYDFVIAPEADPLAIRIHYEGIDSLFTGRDGELVVATDWGRITQKAASVFALPSNRQIECSYVVEGKSFGFALPDVSTELAIVIDPFLTFSSYWGGSADDYGYGIGLDSSGNVYTTGKTSSADFPVRLAIDEIKDVDWDGYITKFSPNCQDYLYSTFYGGSGSDVSNEVAVTPAGEPVVGGGTQSYDLPSISAAQPIKGTDVDGFVLKLNPAGTEIEFATFLGNSRRDSVTGIAIGPNGHVYASGFTFSDNFVVTRDAFQRYSGWYSYGFIVELPPTGDSLIYSSYFACGSDRTKVAVDLDGNIILSGKTMPDRFSVQFPFKNAFDSIKGDGNAGYITKFSPGFDSVVFSTYISGDNGTSLEAMELDTQGRIYVAGSVFEGGYPLLNPLDPSVSHYHDGVVSIVGPNGDLQFSTYWGDWEYSGDVLEDITVDGSGNIYVLGAFTGPRYPLKNAFDSFNEHWEGVYSPEATLTKFSPMGRGVEYCSFLGGSGIDSAGSIVVDKNGTVYIVGTNYLGGFPMVNPLDSTFQGVTDYNTDAYIAIVGDQITDVEVEEDQSLPTTFVLHQNYPNPFNGETVIQFDLPRAVHIELVVYNILGRKIKTLTDGRFEAGSHKIVWDGKGKDNRPEASGVYFYQLQYNGQYLGRKSLLLK
ncbi:MAG: SBBP repeat-containing protein [bacterium]|nr:SBBP repeat-containing protein [bacterium]